MLIQQAVSDDIFLCGGRYPGISGFDPKLSF
jgi:hypothetical protein